jgi:hypothetical protein
MIKKNKINDKVILLLSIFSIFFILTLCVNTFYWSDDYAFLLDLNKNGVIKHCVSWYFEWDGRTLTLGGFIQALGLLYLPIELLTFCWSVCFLASCVLAFYIINEELDFGKQQLKIKLLVITSIMMTFWLSSYTFLAEVIYWGVGGYYSLILLIGAIWIFWYLKIKKNEAKISKKIGFIFFSILAAASTQNLTISLIVLVLLTMLIDLLESNKKNMLFNLIVFISLFSGLLYITLAPGNWLRMNTVKNELGLSLEVLVKNYFLILYYYLSRATLLLPLSFLCGTSIALTCFSYNKNNTIKWIKFSFKTNVCNLLKNTKWLLVALSSIFPFVVFPELATFRTTIYFMYFVFIFIIIIILKIAKMLFVYEENKSSIISNVISKSFFLFIIFGTISFTYTNFSKGLILKKAILERESKLKDPEKDAVELKIIDKVLIPKCYEFYDFSLDNSKGKFGTISYQEEYYNKTITIIK